MAAKRLPSEFNDDGRRKSHTIAAPGTAQLVRSKSLELKEDFSKTMTATTPRKQLTKPLLAEKSSI